jgi:Cyclic nucleotide-binding domain
MKEQAYTYRVWALDDVIYGPVALEVLRGWVLDERINGDSWLFCEESKQWSTAANTPGLTDLFAVEVSETSSDGVRGATLRRIKAFGSLNDEQLGVVARMGERVHYPAYTTILKAGTPGNSVYFVLDGQVRQRIMVKGREILIGIQEVGGVFGQLSVFDNLPRITDVLTDSAVTLFHLPSEGFRTLCTTRADIAAPILLALGRTLATRIRSDDKHLCEIVAMTEG